MNPKYIAGFGVFGFVVSFLVGLISGNSIGIVFLRAIISCVVCIVVWFGGWFVYTRFLAGAADFSSEKEVQTEEAHDLNVDDDVLVEDNGPSFILDTATQLKVRKATQEATNVAPLSESAPSVASTPPASASVSNAPVSSVTSAPSSSSASLATSAPPTKPTGASNFADDSLDALPDFGSFSTGDDNDSSGGADSVEEETSASTFVAKDLNEVTSGFSDASLMAQALRTVLAEEN